MAGMVKPEPMDLAMRVTMVEMPRTTVQRGRAHVGESEVAVALEAGVMVAMVVVAVMRT